MDGWMEWGGRGSEGGRKDGTMDREQEERTIERKKERRGGKKG